MPAPTNEDDLKRRARRRLIGAVALTLVAVIVLPLMLEDEPPPAAHLQVHMPTNNKTPDFIPIAPPPELPPDLITQAPPVIHSPAPNATPKTETPSESKRMMAELQYKPESKPKPAREPKPKPAVVEAKPRPTMDEPQRKLEIADVQKPPKPNRAPPIESKPITEKSPTYVVQLGAFSDEAKTADLKQRVHDLGMSGYTEKSGALIRVRVGPFSSREAAASAAAKLSAAGVQGQVMPK